MSASAKGHRSKVTREILLLLVPFLLAIVVGWFFWKKAQLAPRLLASPVLVSHAFWAGDGWVTAVSSTANLATPTPSISTNFLAWNNADGELLANVTGPNLRTSVAPSPDSSVWATFEQKNSKLRLLDTVNGFTPLGELSLVSATPRYHYLHWISKDRLLDLSQEMKINAPVEATVVNTRDLAIDQQQTAIVRKSLPWLKTGIESFQISPDGKMALVHEMENYAKSNTNSPAPAAMNTGQRTSTTVPTMVSTGRRLSLISWPDCREIKRFDGDMWSAASWSADSKAAYALAGIRFQRGVLRAEIVRFDIASGKSSATPLDTAGLLDVKSPAKTLEIDLGRFSPDGRLLIIPQLERNGTTNNLTGRVFDVASGKQLGEIVPPEQAGVLHWPQCWSGIDFSPDGRNLLLPLETGVQIWNLEQFAAAK